MKKLFWEIATQTIGNSFDTFECRDPKINSVPWQPRIDVWTKFEEGRSRCSLAIDKKQFEHI